MGHEGYEGPRLGNSKESTLSTHASCTQMPFKNEEYDIPPLSPTAEGYYDESDRSSNTSSKCKYVAWYFLLRTTDTTIVTPKSGYSNGVCIGEISTDMGTPRFAPQQKGVNHSQNHRASTSLFLRRLEPADKICGLTIMPVNGTFKYSVKVSWEKDPESERMQCRLKHILDKFSKALTDVCSVNRDGFDTAW